VKWPRISIGKLMAAVAFLAANLAAVRFLYTHDLGLLFQVGAIGLAGEFALYRMIRRRGPARFFWAGFLTAAPGTMALAAWCMDHYRMKIGMSWSRFVTAVLPRWALDDTMIHGKLILGSLFALCVFLPQCILATLVGGIVWGTGRAFGRDAGLESPLPRS
jgi:hypothetical protein